MSSALYQKCLYVYSAPTVQLKTVQVQIIIVLEWWGQIEKKRNCQVRKIKKRRKKLLKWSGSLIWADLLLISAVVSSKVAHQFPRFWNQAQNNTQECLEFYMQKANPRQKKTTQQLSCSKCNSVYSIAIKMDCTAKSIRGKGITWYNCTILNHLYRLSTVFFCTVFVFHRRDFCVFGVLLFYGNLLLLLLALRTYRASVERFISWMNFSKCINAEWMGIFIVFRAWEFYFFSRCMM